MIAPVHVHCLSITFMIGKMLSPLFSLVFLVERFSKYFDFTCIFSGERSLPFGLFVKSVI